MNHEETFFFNDVSKSEGPRSRFQPSDGQSAGHPEKFERQSRSIPYRHLDIVPQRQIRIRAEGVDNNIP
jgi:hypothetical protein